jgi:hypothetical protein
MFILTDDSDAPLEWVQIALHPDASPPLEVFDLRTRMGFSVRTSRLVERRFRETTEIDYPLDLHTKQSFALGLRAIPFILQKELASKVCLANPRIVGKGR